MARILHDIGFVHLHVHSSYSLLEGALKVAQLAKLAAADKQPALERRPFAFDGSKDAS